MAVAQAQSPQQQQQLLLSPLVSLHRLEQLRRLVAPAGSQDSGKPRAILLIGGVDSRDDELNSLLLNHLFTAQTAESGAILNAALEDCMLLVHAAGTHLYIASQSGTLASGVAQMWPHLTVTALPKPSNDDSDAQTRFEDHKMDAFRNMTAPFKSVGVVFGDLAEPSPAGKPSPKAIVERWPIVQSYAFDPAGRRPFFTMEKDVLDVSADAARLLKSGPSSAPYDAQIVLQDMLYESASLIASQFGATLNFVEGQVRRGVALGKITKGEVSNLFASTLELYASHCRVGAKLPLDTSKDVIVTIDTEVARSAVITFTHPTKPLRVCRSYALLGSHGSETLEASRQLAAGLLAGAQVFFCTAAARSAIAKSNAAACTAAWQQFLAEAKTPVGSSELTVLRSFDSAVPSFHVYASIANERGVTVGDTFLVTVGDAENSTSGCITSCVPYVEGVLEAPLDGNNSPVLKLVEDSLDMPPSQRKPVVLGDGTDLGKIQLDVSRADGAAVLIGGVADLGNATTISASAMALSSRAVGSSGGGTACFCEKGLLVSHPRYGVIGPVSLANVAVFNPPDTTTPITVRLIVPETPASWCSGMAAYVLLRASSFARREFLGSIYPKWRAAGTAAVSPLADPANVNVLPHILPAGLHFGLKFADVAANADGKLGVFKEAPLGDDLDPFPSAPDTLAGLFARGGSSSVGDSPTKIEDEDPESDARRVDRDARRSLAAAAPQLVLAAHALHCPPPGASAEQTDAAATVRVEVHLVSGGIAAGKHKLALAMLRSLDAEAAASRGASGQSTFLHRTKLSAPARDDGLGWNSGRAEEDLRGLVRAAEDFQKQNPSRAASRVTCAYVVVVPAAAAIADVFATVRGVAGCAIASSTAVVNPDTFFLDPPSQAGGPGTIPGVLSWRSIIPGFFDSLLLLPATRGRHGASESLGRVERAIRYGLNASLPAAFGAVYEETGALPSGAGTTDDDVADSLCGPLLTRDSLHYCYGVDEVIRRTMRYDAEGDSHDPASWPINSAAQRVARRVITHAAANAGYTSHTVCAMAQPFLPQVVALTFANLPIIEPDLLDFMSHLTDAITTTSASGSPFRSVFRASGVLHVEGREMELSVVRFKSQLNRLRRSKTAAPAPTLRNDQAFYFFTDGSATADEKVQMERYLLRRVAFRGSLVGDVLLPKEREQDKQAGDGSLRLRGVDPRPIISRKDLTDADLDRIASDAATNNIPLPEGWSYDGVGMYHCAETSEQVPRRPDAEELAVAFIQSHNAAAAEFNTKLAEAAAESARRPTSAGVMSARGRR